MSSLKRRRARGAAAAEEMFQRMKGKRDAAEYRRQCREKEAERQREAKAKEGAGGQGAPGLSAAQLVAMAAALGMTGGQGR